MQTSRPGWQRSMPPPSRWSTTPTGTVRGADHRRGTTVSAAAAAADPHTECETPWYGPGRTRTLDCLTALALAELTVHGYDIATGTGRPWPISA